MQTVTAFNMKSLRNTRYQRIGESGEIILSPNPKSGGTGLSPAPYYDAYD